VRACGDSEELPEVPAITQATAQRQFFLM